VIVVMRVMSLLLSAPQVLENYRRGLINSLAKVMKTILKSGLLTSWKPQPTASGQMMTELVGSCGFCLVQRKLPGKGLLRW